MKIILAFLLLMLIIGLNLISTKPVYASTCNIIKSTDPINPTPDQDVKLNLDTSQTGQYTISVNNQTTGSKTPTIVTIPSESQVSIGKFLDGSFITFQVYTHDIASGLVLCSSSTPDFHVTTDGSGNYAGSGKTTGGAGLDCKPPQPNSIYTALGCISYDPANFVTAILKWFFGFAGGVALLLMILGGFQMVTSSGNPDALKSGQEQFSSALIGLVFVLLSVTLLQIIGVDILNIPGLKQK